jgi:hypothetical protein
MQRGSAGGRACVERHGKQYMAEIGRKGFASLVASKFQGDRQGCIDWLHARAHEKMIEGFADRELARMLDQGEQIASIDLPVISEPDEEIPW